MDKDLIKKYKEETGKGAVIVIALERCRFTPNHRLVEESVAVMLETKWSIAELSSQEYVLWLEEQLKEKMK